MIIQQLAGSGSMVFPADHGGRLRHRYTDGEGWSAITGYLAAHNTYTEGGIYVNLSSHTTTDEWDDLSMGAVSFDTRALTFSPSAGYLKIWVTSAQQGSWAPDDVELCGFAPASDTATVESDWPSSSLFTLGSPAYTVPASETGAWHTYTLGALGLAQVTAGGWSHFSLRLESVRSDSEPTWSSSSTHGIECTGDGAVGGAKGPKLIVYR